MSYITDFKSAPFSPFKNISTGVPNQAYSALPASGAQPSSGSGSFQPECEGLIGSKWSTGDGRTLALVRNGAVALSPAKLIQGPAEQTTAFRNLAMTVPTTYPATAGKTQIYVTNGSTVIKENQFRGGYAVISAGTGIGQSFKIGNHAGCAASGAVVINLDDPIQTTLDATSTVNLVENPYDGVLIQVASGSTQTSGPVGITLYNIAASTAATFNGTTGALTANGTSQYGFVVVHGPCAATLTTGGVSLTVGAPLTYSTTAGSLISAVSTNFPQLAWNLQTQVDAKCGLVYLNL